MSVPGTFSEQRPAEKDLHGQPEHMATPVITWETDPAALPRLVQLFLANLDPTYISFSEMQEGRATSAHTWHPALHAHLTAELTAALSASPPSLAVARLNQHPVGLALVALHPHAPQPYAVLQDLIVDHPARGRGVGRALLTWVLDACTQAGCPRVFLESGHRNTAAHEFFTHAGFHPVATVFVRDP